MPEFENGLELFNLDPVIAGRAVFSIVFVVGLYLLALALRQLVDQRVEDPRARFGLKKAVTWVTVSVVLVVLGILWLERLGGLSVALGLVAAGAAFSLREAISSFAGWLLITSGRAYDIGDRIELGGIQGDVIGFGVLRTSLMEIGNWVKGDQPTGRIVTVSNSVVFQQPVYNYTRYFHFLWDELSIPITFSSNLKKAREMILRVANEYSESLVVTAKEELESMARRYRVGETELRPSIFVSFNDNWVELSLRYITEARLRRQTRHRLSERILEALSPEPDIRFASETMMVTLRESEQDNVEKRAGPD